VLEKTEYDAFYFSSRVGMKPSLKLVEEHGQALEDNIMQYHCD
jgi:hypothetical protein